MIIWAPHTAKPTLPSPSFWPPSIPHIFYLYFSRVSRLEILNYCKKSLLDMFFWLKYKTPDFSLKREIVHVPVIKLKNWRDGILKRFFTVSVKIYKKQSTYPMQFFGCRPALFSTGWSVVFVFKNQKSQEIFFHFIFNISACFYLFKHFSHI